MKLYCCEYLFNMCNAARYKHKDILTKKKKNPFLHHIKMSKEGKIK